MERTSSILLKLSSGKFNKVFSELYGGEQYNILKQTERYQNTIRQFETSFGEREVELFSAPGRTEIGGNHTDHNSGRVLAGAVNLDNIAVAARNSSNQITIESAGFSKIKVDLTRLTPSNEEFFTSSSLVRGICAYLKTNGYTIGGFDAVVDGNVPKGSGLSSSASFEVLIGVIVSYLFNEGKIDPVQNAIAGQYAENNFFGKPCGLMDQMACSVGGLITIDFENPSTPTVKKIDFDFIATGYSLVIVDTGGNHANLNEEYASLPFEMKSVASKLGAQVLRQVSLERILESIPLIREEVGDRAILRAIHFEGDNQRVAEQVAALEKKDFKRFLSMVIESGYSSYMYNQNIYSVTNVREQGISLALAMSEILLKGNGAWRVHGGGFAGTIQAFVPNDLTGNYVSHLEHVFVKGACHTLFIRSKGALKIDCF